MQKLISILFMVLLSACSATSSVKSDYSLSKASNRGVLLTSITYLGRPSAYIIQYKAEGSSEISTIQIGSSESTLSINAFVPTTSPLGVNGDLMAVELPAGKYRIIGWQVKSNSATVTHKNTFEIPFEIVAGKASYIGRFGFDQVGSLGPTQTASKVDYKDESVMDLLAMMSKYPKIQKQDILMQVEQAPILMLGGESMLHLQLYDISTR